MWRPKVYCLLFACTVLVPCLYRAHRDRARTSLKKTAADQQKGDIKIAELTEQLKVPVLLFSDACLKLIIIIAIRRCK